MAMSTKKVAGEDSVHYVPPRKKRKQGTGKMQPPLTPMIDVTFQLLLFFLMTFTFRQAEGQIPGTLPQSGQSGRDTATDLETEIKITLRPCGRNYQDCQYEIEGVPHMIRDRKELAAVLESKARNEGKEVPVVIKALDYVQWQYVVETFNQAVRAEFKNVGFATE